MISSGALQYNDRDFEGWCPLWCGRQYISRAECRCLIQTIPKGNKCATYRPAFHQGHIQDPHPPFKSLLLVAHHTLGSGAKPEAKGILLANKGLGKAILTRLLGSGGGGDKERAFLEI
jgi:hypothetical protein